MDDDDCYERMDDLTVEGEQMESGRTSGRHSVSHATEPRLTNQRDFKVWAWERDRRASAGQAGSVGHLGAGSAKNRTRQVRAIATIGRAGGDDFHFGSFIERASGCESDIGGAHEQQDESDATIPRH